MDTAAIEEMFAGLGPVTIKRMFGGKGIYHAGLIVAVEVQGEVMLKGDAQTAPSVEAAGGRRWTYAGRRGPVRLPYWSVPPTAFDDADEMASWVSMAHAAALRSARPVR